MVQIQQTTSPPSPPILVCQTGASGARECREVGSTLAQQHFAAECIALGFGLLSAVIVGHIAVTFVGMVGKIIQQQRRRRERKIQNNLLNQKGWFRRA